MIVVDASVAVKWTVAEPLHSEALSLTRGDITLVAPNLVIIETLNVLRRKLKRSELRAVQLERAAQELPKAFDLLIPESTLSEQIANLAATLDHSVYDCAYLACALKLNMPLVTADAHFARKLQTSGFGAHVLELGPGIDDALSANQQESSTEIQALRLWRVFDDTVSYVINSIRMQPPTFTFHSVNDLRPAFESPAYLRLNRFIRFLSDDAKARLLALSWFGRSHTHESWSEVLDHAGRHVAMRDPNLDAYIISTFATLAAGLEKLQLEPLQSESEKS